MNSNDFVQAVTELVETYIENHARFDSDPQIRVNPVTFAVGLINGSEMQDEIADSVETVEDAAGAQGEASENATDYQVKQNPDFYAVSTLLTTSPTGVKAPDKDAINRMHQSTSKFRLRQLLSVSFTRMPNFHASTLNKSPLETKNVTGGLRGARSGTRTRTAAMAKGF